MSTPFSFQFLIVPVNHLKRQAQITESLDALVSNTSGAIHPGSIPGLGTEAGRVSQLSPLIFFVSRNSFVS